MIPTAFLSPKEAKKNLWQFTACLRNFLGQSNSYLSTSGVSKDILLKKLKGCGQTNLENGAEWITVVEICDTPKFI